MSHLFIYELTIQSSYINNTELPANDDSFDTVQWWINDDSVWRIRLFDVDSDIHVHSIKRAMDITEIELNMSKNYSGVMVGRYDFSDINLDDSVKIMQKMKCWTLECNPSRAFAFWNHDGRRYHSQSTPERI